MALTDSDGMNTTMLVGPTGQANGMGMFGDGNGWWILLLFILLGGNAWGGWGNGNGVPMAVNTQNDVQRGFDQSAIMNGINGISGAVCNGFANVQQSLCNGFAGVNATVNSGFANAETANNARQMANMQQMFGVQSALQNCCCENRANIADLKYTVATENCADRAALSDGVKDILSATQAQTQAILNQLCADKIEQKNDLISQLRSELMYARGQASQDVQTAALQLGQRQLANEVEQYVAPRAIPAYVVQNPNCCTNACGCTI